MRIFKYTLSLALAGILSMACAQDKKANSAAQDMAQNIAIIDEENISDYPTIVGVASSNDQFSTLVTAVAAADLVRTLESTGPFTVFAPTNEAFEKLPTGTVETLLKAENKDQLTSILVYHVIAGEYRAEDVIKAIKDNDGTFTAQTVEGSTIVFSLNEGAVVLTDVNGNASTVITADVNASNGVIHAIDNVIMPAK